MKKNDAPAALPAGRRPSLWGRFLRFKQSMGVRSRIFLYFLAFTALLLMLLWLFQIVLLDDFYRLQKTDMLKSSSQSIVQNINNENLDALVDRIAEENNVCILVTSDTMVEMASADISPGCIVHHMNPRDLQQIAGSLENDGVMVTTFPMKNFRNRMYDEKKFLGRVPPSDDGETRSMMTVQRAVMADGTTAYVFLNAMVTPVTATVQTIRNELYVITAILILLSFLISLVLSRRITRPLVETTQAAGALSRGEYTPVQNVGYREIAQLNAQLTQTARDLRRVEEMQQELIANISHDLRTPLTLIEGYAEVMRDLPGENTPENMQVIIDETKRLSTLVNAVLELSKARSSAAGGEPVRFDLTQTVRGIMTRYAKLTEQDGYHILFEPEGEAWVIADEVQAQQVLYNLINNALTYTGKDKRVTIAQRVADGKVRISVSDTGEGIAPEDLPYIWSRYYRGGKPHKRATVGSGLGLNIVKGILDRYGLSYGVESKLGEGSTFWFELPVAQQSPESLWPRMRTKRNKKCRGKGTGLSPRRLFCQRVTTAKRTQK